MTTVLFNGYLVVLRKAAGLYYPPKNKAEYIRNRPELSFPGPKTQGGKRGRCIQLEFPTFRWTGKLPAHKKVTISEVEEGSIESSTLVLPDRTHIPGRVDIFSEAEFVEATRDLDKPHMDYINSPQYAGIMKVVKQVIEGQNAMVASNLALVEETRRVNENCKLALRHALKMEDSAREARTKPADAAAEVYRMVWGVLSTEEATILSATIENDGNMNKTAAKLKVPYSTVWRCISKCRKVYTKANMELPVYLLNREERMAMKRLSDANPLKRTASGDITPSIPNDVPTDE